jgi:hypothetical protein
LTNRSDANRGRVADQAAPKAHCTSRSNPDKPRRTCRLGADASVEDSGRRSGEIGLDTTFHRRKSNRISRLARFITRSKQSLPFQRHLLSPHQRPALRQVADFGAKGGGATCYEVGNLRSNTVLAP